MNVKMKFFCAEEKICCEVIKYNRENHPIAWNHKKLSLLEFIKHFFSGHDVYGSLR